jgi:hypothetical protein
MTEEEFWENYADLNKDTPISDQNMRRDSMDSSNAGISNRPFILMPR